MKKLLLLSLCAMGFASQAQVYWEENSTGFSTASTGVNEIRYVDANDVWITGYDGSGGMASFRVYARSLDGGTTWTNGPINLGSTDLGIGSIMPLSPTVAYVAAFPNPGTNVQGGIWRTTDGGTVWTKQASAAFNTGDESFTNLVYFWDQNNGIAAGDPAGGYFEIYLTSDGGANWTRVPSSSLPTPLSLEYGYTRIYETFGNTIWLGTNKGRLLKSPDRGITWFAYQTPSSDLGDLDLGANFSFRDENNGILILKDWTQSITTDGGATWTTPTIPDGYVRNGDLTYVHGVPGITGTPDILVGIGPDVNDQIRGSSFSTDNGASWLDIGEPIDAVQAVEFFDATHGLASGFTASATEGGIYHWINDLTSFLATVDFQATKALTASPNPTTGILDIAGKNISQVSVYDILGKQVSNANYTALNNVSLNLSAFNNGVYMVKVTNNEGSTSTIKVVKQ